MEMVFLVFHIGYGVVVMPEQYPREQCERIKAKQSWASDVICIPVPEAKLKAQDKLYGYQPQIMIPEPIDRMPMLESVPNIRSRP